MKSLKKLLMMLLILSVFSVCAKKSESDDNTTLLLLLYLVSPGPFTVKFVNNSGATESYSFHKVAGCTDAATYTMTANPVTTGTTTAFETVPTSGTYYIKYGVGCVTGSKTFAKNTAYTCTSTVTTITCL